MLTTTTEHTKVSTRWSTFIENNLKVFKKATCLYEDEDWRRAETFLKETVEAFSKAFDMTLKSLPKQFKNLLDNFIKTLIQRYLDVCLFDRFDNKDEIWREKIFFDKRRGGKLGLDKYYYHYSLVD